MKPNFVHDFIRNHLLEKCGFDTKKLPSLESMKKTEWSPVFEKLMRNRLIMGAIRYGLLKSKGKTVYNRVDSIRQRMDLYEQEGNAEHLVDCANLCLLEFEEPNHLKFHFKATDDGIHTEKRYKGE